MRRLFRPMHISAVRLPATASSLRLVGDPVLRAAAQPVSKDDIQTTDFKKLTETMVKTMRTCEVVGISAPQIGQSLQVFATEFPIKYIRSTPRILGMFTKEEMQAMEMGSFPLKIIVNPKIKVIDPTITELPEGSISIPGHRAFVPRYRGVELEALDENGEELKWSVCGWPARIIQHHVDHLNGTLYIDKMKPGTFENLYWKMNHH